MQFKTTTGETVDIKVEEVNRTVEINEVTIVYYDNNTRKAKLPMTIEQFYTKLETEEAQTFDGFD